jgi:hypothetical protein
MSTVDAVDVVTYFACVPDRCRLRIRHGLVVARCTQASGGSSALSREVATTARAPSPCQNGCVSGVRISSPTTRSLVGSD